MSSEAPPEVDQLYSSERGRLSRFIARMVGNRSTAEEIVQDAFSKYIAQADHQSIEQPRAYLKRAARNLALNYLRHMRQGVEISVDQQVYNAVADQKASPEMETLYRQELRRLLTALSHLPARRREVFILNRFEGLTYAEIASRLSLSKRTVINHVFNALDSLDLELGPDFLEFA